MKSLKICIISPNFPPTDRTCGVGDYTEKLSGELHKLGHDIIVLTSERYRGRSKSGDASVIRFSKTWYLSAAIKLSFWTLRHNPDVINLHHTPALYGFWFRLLICFINLITPVIVSYHTLHRSTLFSKFEAFLLLKICDGFISTNEEITSIIKKIPLIRKDFCEIPIGTNILPTENIEKDKLKAKKKLGIKENILVLSNFGLFYPGKGLETLLYACNLLKNEIEDFILFLLGSHRAEDKKYLDSVRKLIIELGLQEKVRLTGFLDETQVSQHLFAADIYVVPFDRGVSIRRTTLMTGLVHGLPVISTFPELSSRYIVDGENILLVQPKDPKALFNTILRLWYDYNLRLLLEKNARKLSEEFNWDRIGRRYAEEFSRLLE